MQASFYVRVLHLLPFKFIQECDTLINVLL
jgi:hypothetical protein